MDSGGLKAANARMRNQHAHPAQGLNKTPGNTQDPLRLYAWSNHPFWGCFKGNDKRSHPFCGWFYFGTNLLRLLVSGRGAHHSTEISTCRPEGQFMVGNTWMSQPWTPTYWCNFDPTHRTTHQTQPALKLCWCLILETKHQFVQSPNAIPSFRFELLPGLPRNA